MVGSVVGCGVALVLALLFCRRRQERTKAGGRGSAGGGNQLSLGLLQGDNGIGAAGATIQAGSGQPVPTPAYWSVPEGQGVTPHYRPPASRTSESVVGGSPHGTGTGTGTSEVHTSTGGDSTGTDTTTFCTDVSSASNASSTNEYTRWTSTDSCETSTTEEVVAFDAAMIKRVTNNFDDSIKADEGSFGTVFHATLPDGREVAIKVLKPPRKGKKTKRGAEKYTGEASFRREVQVLGKYRHPNIVALLGHCLTDGGATLLGPSRARRPCLVYEWLDGQSLRRRLMPPKAPGAEGGYSQASFLGHDTTQLRLQEPSLTWRERLLVASDVARGLEFLPSVADPPIVHQDVKTANIMLNVSASTLAFSSTSSTGSNDSRGRGRGGRPTYTYCFGVKMRAGQLIAKLADFGTARATPQLAYGEHASTEVVVGTGPYIAPETYQLGQVSAKTDAYAFGVVLLELLTGRPPSDKTSRLSVADKMAVVLDDPEKLLPAVLDKQAGEWRLEAALRLADVARRCLEHHNSRRCTVADVRPELDALVGRGARPNPTSGVLPGAAHVSTSSTRTESTRKSWFGTGKRSRTGGRANANAK